MVYRLVNISRDAFEGTMVLQDSILNKATKKVLLSRKDEVLVDTLFLSFQAAPSTRNVHCNALYSQAWEGQHRSSSGSLTRPSTPRHGSCSSRLLRTVRSRKECIGSGFPYVLARAVRPDTLQRANVLVVDRDALAGDESRSRPGRGSAGVGSTRRTSGSVPARLLTGPRERIGAMGTLRVRPVKRSG